MVLYGLISQKIYFFIVKNPFQEDQNAQYNIHFLSFPLIHEIYFYKKTNIANGWTNASLSS